MAITERLAIVLETVGTSTVVRDFNRVGGAAGGLGKQVGGASGAFKTLGAVGSQTLGAGGPLAAGMAAATVGVTAMSMAGSYAVNTYNDLAQSVLAFQRASGASAEDASFLVAALDDVGIEAEVGTKAMFQLARRIGENSEKLREHGITAAYDAQGNVDLSQTLLNVADAYSQTSDPAARAQMLTDAFGKSGQALIPILERGRAGIEALYEGAESTNQILTQADIQRAEDFRIAMDNLGDSVRALGLVAGEALVPILTEAANALTTLIDKARSIDDIPILGDILRNVAKGAFAFANGSDAAKNGLVDLDGAAKQAATAIDDDTKALNELTRGLLAVPAAQRAYEQSTRAITTAENNLADARDEYNKLLREGAVDEEKVADARRSLADATRALGSAQRRLRESQEEYNEALSYFNAVGGDTAWDRLQDAQDNLADAEDGVASAAEREQGAQEDLQKALAGDPDFNDKLARAKRGLTDAETGLADAIYTSSQRAFELDRALTEQNTLLGENAGQVAAVRTEWELLIAKKPEIAAFLAGPLAALGTVLGTATAPEGSAGFVQQRGGDFSWASPTGTTSTGTGASAQSTLKTVGDITINVKELITDPAGFASDLAKKIVWNLN